MDSQSSTKQERDERAADMDMRCPECGGRRLQGTVRIVHRIQCVRYDGPVTR